MYVWGVLVYVIGFCILCIFLKSQYARALSGHNALWNVLEMSTIIIVIVTAATV